MTHLGQRLSALIDGELDVTERERVLVHMARCKACQDEAAALRTLKRRMNALGETAAGAGLTGRLMGLSNPGSGQGMVPGQVMGPGESMRPAEEVWAPMDDWQVREDTARPETRATKFFLAGSVVVFLAGLGTAAVIAGGEPSPRAPAPPVTPSVNVMRVSSGSNVPDPGGQLTARYQHDAGGLPWPGVDRSRTPRLP